MKRNITHTTAESKRSCYNCIFNNLVFAFNISSLFPKGYENYFMLFLLQTIVIFLWFIDSGLAFWHLSDPSIVMNCVNVRM